MADRRAEQDAVLGRDGEQGDLAVELDQFLDDHARPVAAHLLDRMVPGIADLVRVADNRLPLARRGHHRLDDAGHADVLGSRECFLAVLGEAIAGGDEAELARGELANPVAVHRQPDRPGRRRDAPAFLLELDERRGVDRLELGDDDVGLVLLDRGAKRGAVEHREDLERVGHLHRRGVGVAVARDHPAAEALGGDGELAAELARAEQHQGGGEHGRAIAARRMVG